MPSTLTEASPLVYPSSITIPNPGEPRTIESIGGGASANGIGLKGVNNRVAYLASRCRGPLIAPMQQVSSVADTNQDLGADTSCIVHRARLTGTTPQEIWLVAAVGVGSFWSQDGVNWDATNDTASIGGSESSWREMASDGNRVVLVGDNEVRYTAWPISWTSCTGGVTSGAWRAIVHDGTNFVAGSSAGTFAYSSDGQAFTVVNGGAGWLAGPNVPAQIATGKGPDGTSDRLIAVPNSGDLEVFAVSDNNGATWSDVTSPSSTLEWRGIAYRETDHTWVAVGEAAGNTVVHASTDGGATWSHQKTFAGGSLSRLWLLNDHFVLMQGGRLVYSLHDDVTEWRLGFSTKRATPGGDVYSVRSFVRGGGCFGWLYVEANVSLYFAQSAAGGFDVGDQVL